MTQAVTMVAISKPVLPALQKSTLSGTLATNQVITTVVSLKPRSPAALQAFCDSVSNPKSPTYRHFITPAQVGSQFGATSTNTLAVVNYLKSKGLKIVLSASNNMAVIAQGTIAQMQTAFGTTVKQYKGPDPTGATITFRANSTPIKMPSTIAPLVVDVSGIETYVRPKAFATQTLTPFLTRSLYNSQPSYNNGFHGEGRTVAVTSLSGYRLSNIPTMISLFNLPVPVGGAGSNIQVITVGTPSGTGAENFEGDLDIEMELAMAPLAKILVYDSTDVIAILTQEANDNLADVLSESYGFPFDLAAATAAHNQHLAMTAQGQTYVHASGDSGTTIEPFTYPHYEPEATAIGGTTATVNTPNGDRLSEVAWSPGGANGGGGGGWVVNNIPFNVLPSWQVGNGVPTGINARLIPDLSLHAAGNGGAYLAVFNGAQTPGDGTSFSSPVFAGMLTTLEQRLATANVPFRLGRINDLVYSQNGRPDVWFDVTSGSIGNLPNGQLASATLGWDFATGWGAPDMDALYESIVTPQVPLVDVAPDDANVYTGSLADGDQTSLATADGQTFDIDSVFVDQFGQAAGFDSVFTLPGAPVTATVHLQAASATVGGTNMVWAYNWSVDPTGVNPSGWVLIGSTILQFDGASMGSLPIRSNLANYVNGSNQIKLRVRGHLPIRPIVGSFPAQFTYSVDLLEIEMQ